MKRNYLIAVILPLFIFSGCNLPAAEPEVTIHPETAYTQAAQTIVVQLTEIAQGEDPDGSAPVTETPEVVTATMTQTIAPSKTSTPEPSTTPTETPTPTAFPTVTPSSQDPRALLGDPDWQDAFNNSNNWSLYDDEHVSFQITDGFLIMEAYNADGRDSWMITWPEPEQYYLELSAQIQECSDTDRYGLIFQTDATEGYLFGVACDGRYSLRTWDGDEFDALINWTTSDAYNSEPGQNNRIGVLFDDSVIQLYINGMLVDEIEDDTFTEGGFGVFVGARETENLRVSVDEMAYWKLP